MNACSILVRKAKPTATGVNELHNFAPGTPSPVTQAKDLIKSHFYHLKKFYGLTD
jgi:hypothetical protein